MLNSELAKLEIHAMQNFVQHFSDTFFYKYKILHLLSQTVVVSAARPVIFQTRMTIFNLFALVYLQTCFGITYALPTPSLYIHTDYGVSNAETCL